MLQNPRVTAFTVSELLRENQQGGKIGPTPSEFLKLFCEVYRGFTVFEIGSRTKTGAQILMNKQKKKNNNKASICHNNVNTFDCYFRTNIFSFNSLISTYLIH